MRMQSVDYNPSDICIAVSSLGKFFGHALSADGKMATWFVRKDGKGVDHGCDDVHVLRHVT